MKNLRNIEFNYLSSKPTDPKEGDCYQDSFGDGGYWIYYSGDWYWSMNEDIDIIKESRNRKIDNLLNGKK